MEEHASERERLEKSRLFVFSFPLYCFLLVLRFNISVSGLIYVYGSCFGILFVYVLRFQCMRKFSPPRVFLVHVCVCLPTTRLL